MAPTGTSGTLLFPQVTLPPNVRTEHTVYTVQALSSLARKGYTLLPL